MAQINYRWIAICLMIIISRGTIFPSNHAATERLWQVFSQENEGEVLAAFAEGADINASIDGTSVLESAIYFDCRDVFKYLLRAGARIDEEGRPDLWYAVRKNRHDMIKALLNHGARIDAPLRSWSGSDEATSLLYSFFDRTITNETRMKLVELGADVNAANADGETPLHRAASFGNEVMFDFLVRHGASTNAIRKDGHTILMSAAWGRSNYIVSRLIQDGFDVNARRKDIGVTALWFAVSDSHRPINPHTVMSLLEAGADVNVRHALRSEESIASLVERNRDTECLKAIQQKLAQYKTSKKISKNDREQLEKHIGKDEDRTTLDKCDIAGFNPEDREDLESRIRNLELVKSARFSHFFEGSGTSRNEFIDIQFQLIGNILTRNSITHPKEKTWSWLQALKKALAEEFKSAEDASVADGCE